jgi:hypothetical protein
MKTLVKIAGAALLALGVSSAADAAMRIGVLRCHVEGGEGYVVGSAHEARCIFTGEGGRHERYVGRMSRIGLDIGVKHRTVLVWAVFAPSAIHHHALAGEYVGASADVAAGIGGGANALIGGNGGTISLQPLSLQHETGVAAGAGAAKLELR